MVFVTGKGGVGKSTVAAAFALAGRRRPAIVCELGTRAQLARAFGRPPPRPGAEIELAPGLCSVSIDPDAALEEWMARHIGRPGAALLARSDAFRYFVAAAPGARELICDGQGVGPDPRGHDPTAGSSSWTRPPRATPSGCCQAPRTFSRLGGVGPIGHQAAHIRDFLADPSRSAIVLVSTPSEMPVTETVELAVAVEETTGRPPDAVIANQVLPDRFDGDEIERIDRALGASEDPCLRAAARHARMAWRRAREQEHHLDRLRAGLTVPVVELPFLFVPALGPRELGTLAAALTVPAPARTRAPRERRDSTGRALLAHA